MLNPFKKPSAKQRKTSFLVAGALWYGFHFATREQALTPVFQRMGFSEDKARVAAGVSRKLIGGAVLGVGSLYWLHRQGRSAASHGLNRQNLGKSLVLTGALKPIFTAIVYANMQKKPMWRYYPEVRTSHFSKPVALASTLGWATYLAGFEFFFRGFLLNRWVAENGLMLGLAKHTALYTLVHLPNNWREMLSCIPMGYVFGSMSLATGSVLSPYLLHLAIASTSDLAAAAANPDIAFLH